MASFDGLVMQAEVLKASKHWHDIGMIVLAGQCPSRMA
jgi:hypothetical protein